MLSANHPYKWSLLLCFLQGIIFLILYPGYFTIYDEAVYLSFVYVLQHGTIFANDFPTLIGSSMNGANCVFKFPPGLPLLLLPFASFGWQGTFMANFSVFCLGSITFAWLLKRFQIRPFWVVLFNFFPPFILYARTLMSDLSGMLFILASFAFCLAGLKWNKKPSWFLSGFLLGFSAVIRYANAVTFPVFILWLFLNKARGWLAFLGGMAVALAGLGIFMFVNSGGQPNAGYGGGGGLFALSYFPEHFKIYLIILLSLYPGLLLSLLFKAKADTPRLLIGGVAAVFVATYSFYYFLQSGTDSWAAALVASSRFILPVQALLLVHYAGVADLFLDKISGQAWWRPWCNKVLASLCLLLGLASTFIINQQHNGRAKIYLQAAVDVKAKLEKNSVVLASTDALKCFNPFWTDGISRLIPLDTFVSMEQVRALYPHQTIQLVTLKRPSTLLKTKAETADRDQIEAKMISEFTPSEVKLSELVGTYSLEVRTLTK